MSSIKGTNVLAPVVPFDTTDSHASHEARYGRGGYRSVADLTERDAIPALRREAGMLVCVLTDGKVWRLGDNLTTWSEFKLGASTWDELSGKPTTFTPTSHNHTASQITDFSSAVAAAAPPTTDASLLTSGTLSASRLPASAVLTSDGRLSDARTPTSHAASHATSGGDAITAASIGAVPSAGGTLTGDLTHAATQTFVSALGSAASPAYTFTGDTNTGVYSPSADQWAVSTGGVKRLRVDHLGDVYVGGEGNLTSGLRYLDVINMDTASSSGSIVRLITLNRDGTAGTPALLVKYKNGQFSIWNGETAPEAFTSFTVGLSEIMRLASTGVVGVGANVPALSSGVGIHCAGSTFRLGTARTPANSTATGNTGEICWDSSYMYVCVATNTWRRILHSTW